MTDRFRGVADRVLDILLESDPEWAGELGDQRFADRLSDHSVEAEADRAGALTDALGALDEIDDTLIPVHDQVDLELLRTRVAEELWRLTELRPHRWNPMEHLPGEGLYPLIVRESLPPEERLRALEARCAAVPDFLATARDNLTRGPGMPRVHVETAISRIEGTVAMLGDDVDALMAAASSPHGSLAAARDTARAALEEHVRWLRSRLDSATADPRIGAREYGARLWYTLDSEITADTLLTRAESDLIALEEEIAEVAAEYDGRPRYRGQVREVLDRIAAESATDADTLRPLCERALARLAERTAELDLVTVPEEPIRLIPMPQARRGIAPAYCDPPGPLAPASEDATLIAVSSPPEEWSAEWRASFHREYNRHTLRTLMAHEGVPGHALQLSHSARYQGGTRVRAALRSGPFIEGWAVYAEELLARAGWDDGEDARLRLMQLKARMRVTLNAIIDARVHAHDLGEAEAMTMLTERGHQEIGEAAGKWRRALLTSAQLATYYVGYREISDLARELTAARPRESRRAVHDAILAHGSPPPRHLRRLLGL